jgi:alpha-tubulin suppressor-like RCC1 family protein
MSVVKQDLLENGMWILWSCTTAAVEDSQAEQWDTSNSEDTQISEPSMNEPEAQIDTGDWPEGSWVVIGGGVWHTCAVDQDQKTHCWGRNMEGQGTPPEGISFRGLTGGRLFSCGLAFDSTIHCWGDYSFDVPEGMYRSISAGKDFLCGIAEDSSIFCTGFTHEPPTGTFVQLDAGDAHVCAINTLGRVECFGQNTSGECDGPEDSFTKVQAGFYHSCARNEDGVHCWGSNQDGATVIPIVQGTELWTGNYHSCGLNENQQAVCWGGESLNLDGGIIGARFTQLQLGGFHTCGITLDDTIMCVGDNAQGQTEYPSD